MADPQASLLFFSSSFCEPCAETRRVLAEVSRLVPSVRIAELDVARDADEAERAGIRTTPTVVIVSPSGDEVFRAEGVPTLNHVLVAVAKAF